MAEMNFARKIWSLYALSWTNQPAATDIQMISIDKILQPVIMAAINMATT